ADLAGAKVESARGQLGRLPRDVDVAIYKHELDRLAASARSRAHQQKSDEGVKLTSTDDPPPAPANPPSGVPAPAPESHTIVQRPYEPDGRIVEMPAPPCPSDPIYRYQRDMDFAIRASRAEWYFGA